MQKRKDDRFAGKIVLLDFAVLVSTFLAIWVFPFTMHFASVALQRETFASSSEFATDLLFVSATVHVCDPVVDFFASIIDKLVKH